MDTIVLQFPQEMATYGIVIAGIHTHIPTKSVLFATVHTELLLHLMPLKNIPVMIIIMRIMIIIMNISKI